MGTALRYSSFRRFFIGSLITQFGDQIQRIALMVLVYEFTHSAGKVAFVMSAQFLVSVLLAPFLAAWAEGQERRRLLVLSQLIQGGIVALIPLVAAHSLLALWLFVFMMALFERLEYPLIAAITPELVPEEALDDANGLVAFTKRFSEVLGVGLAGLLVAWLGAAVAFYLDAVSFVITALLFLGLPRLPAKGRPEGGYWQRVWEGFAFILKTPVLRRVTGGLTAAALFSSVEIVIGVVLAIGVLKVGSAGYGFMEMSLAAGAALGSVLAARAIARVGRARFFVLAVTLFGFFNFLIGAFPIFWWVLVAYFLAGGFNGAMLVPVRGLLQTHTPKEMLVRVFGAVGSMTSTAVLLGTVIGGPVADAIGVPQTYMIAGGLTVLLGLYLFLVGVPEEAA